MELVEHGIGTDTQALDVIVKAMDMLIFFRVRCMNHGSGQNVTLVMLK